jgi:DNA-directed RNA polymerase subunit RPC12/RpoP
VEIECPACGFAMKIPDDAMKGEVYACGDCGESYELTEGRGLKKAEVIGEDWGQ